MSISSVIQAAAALRDVNDQIDALASEKQKCQDRVAEINTRLAALRTERDIKAAALKVEAATI